MNKKKPWFGFLYESNTEEVEKEIDLDETKSVDVVTDSGVKQTDIIVDSMSFPTSGDGVFDQKFNDFFQGVIKDNNIPGIDYFEYREALKKMSSLPDSSKFQMAFDNFKIIDNSLTKESILSSIDHYDGILAKEEKDFELEMELETENEVTLRRKKATDLLSSNKNILQEIQNLQEKISHNQEEAITLNNEAALAEVKIGQTAKNFIKTLTHVRISINTDKAKFSELVQETKIV